MKIALVHEWLDSYAGSERVLEQLLLEWPEADVFAVCDFMPAAERGFLQGKPVTTSFIQRIPFARKHFRKFLGLMPLAIEQLDLSGYDIVISSSHAVAKGVLTGPGQLHISYVHSPMRYAWDLQHQYLREAGLERGVKGAYTRWLLHRMRLWDRASALNPDIVLANSSYIAERIQKTWRRDARVLHPPVDIESFTPSSSKGDWLIHDISRRAATMGAQACEAPCPFPRPDEGEPCEGEPCKCSHSPTSARAFSRARCVSAERR